MRLNHLEDFKVKVPLSFQADNFLVKTASTLADLKLALKLRHQVFLEEGLGRSHETGFDFDSFDHLADHLLIINQETGETIGTYRLISSKFSDNFYSQGEFDLDIFLEQEGVKLELGRACTHIDFRTGRTIDLLWQGLSKYIGETRTRFLFGCSSLKTTNPKEAFSTLKSLEKKKGVSDIYKVTPTKEFQFKNANEHHASAEVNPQILRTLPPLLRSYLHAGSKVHGHPALDKDFKCTDMLTILDLRELNKKFAEHYNPQFG